MSTSAFTPGQLARRILGPYFEPVGNVYRRIFVDLDKIAEALDALMPKGSRVLDIGGGDGALVDRLLDCRPDLKITMCDLAPEIGSFLSPANRAKVQLFPATDFTVVRGIYDFVTLSDVVHHVPVDQRPCFFEQLAGHCEGWQCQNLIVKDIEPGSLRATVAKWMDWYVTGDRHVRPFARSQFAQLAERYFPPARRVSAMPDKPNYCELLSW